MRVSHRYVGAVTAAIGAAAFYGGYLLPPVPGQNVGPNVLPMIVGGGLFLCGLLIALGAGQHFEQEIEAEVVAHTGGAAAAPPPEAEGRFHGLRALIPPGLLIFYVLVSEELGFVLTAAIIALTLCRCLGAPWRSALLVALLAPPAIHFAFYKLLRVPLPSGLLPMPW